MPTYNTLGRIDKFISIAIFISIFINSIVLFTSPFEFYIGYFVMITLIPFFLGRYKIPSYFIYFSLILIAAGVYNIYFNQNTFALFLKIYLGLFMSYLFYYYVIESFNKNVSLLFNIYLKGAYIMAIIGAFQLISFLVGFKFGYDYTWILNKSSPVVGGNLGIRINSLYSEPSQYAIVQAPAVFAAIYKFIHKDFKGFTLWQASISIVIYLLTFSSLGFIGVFLSVVLLMINLGFVRYVIFSIPLVLLIFNILYNNVDEFRDRWDGTKEVFTTSKFELGKSNGSSIILYDNYQVALKNFKENPFFGTGLGSHPIAFEKYSVTKHIRKYGFAGNSADANSMFLRILSETGLFGVLVLIWFLFKFYRSRQPNDTQNQWLISNSILVLIILFLFRQGHYFINGFPFFVLLYYYNKANKNVIIKG